MGQEAAAGLGAGQFPRAEVRDSAGAQQPWLSPQHWHQLAPSLPISSSPWPQPSSSFPLACAGQALSPAADENTTSRGSGAPALPPHHPRGAARLQHEGKSCPLPPVGLPCTAFLVHLWDEPRGSGAPVPLPIPQQGLLRALPTQNYTPCPSASTQPLPQHPALPAEFLSSHSLPLFGLNASGPVHC